MPVSENLIGAVRGAANQWAHKYPGWNHLMHMTNDEISHLISPKVKSEKGAVDSVYKEYIKSGAFNAYEIAS